MLDQYRETEIRTASPEMLVVKMYEGAIRFARQAIDMNEKEFIKIVLKNPTNAAILEGLPALDLPDVWLVSGCLFQTVWNFLTARPVDHGIKDYDRCRHVQIDFGQRP